MTTFKCQVRQKNFTMDEVMKAVLLEDPIVQMIREKHPEWSTEGFICLAAIQAPVIMMSQNRQESVVKAYL